MTKKTKRNPIGSQLFGTEVIRTDEYALMAHIMAKDGCSAEAIALEIDFLDDLLSMQRMQSIGRAFSYTKSGKIRKDYLLTGMIDKRLDMHIEDLKALE